MAGVERAIQRPWLRAAAALGAFELAFYFAYRLGMFVHATASPFWFPDTVLLCALLRSPRRRWWIFVLAPLPIRLFVAVPAEVPVWFLAATFALDSAKGVITAAILQRVGRPPFRFSSVRAFALYAFFAVFLVPAVSAFGGAAARQRLGFEYWLAWEQWFLGDALAQLVITPIVIYWVFGGEWRRLGGSPLRLRELAALTIALVATSYLAFDTQSVGMGFAEPLFYAPVPLLFWSAIRFGMVGATGAVGILAAFAISAASNGHGPFASQSPADTALAIQHFLLLRAAPLYLVAVIIEQKESVERSLRESERRFRETHQNLVHAARLAVVGELTAVIAHEIKQPLSAILTNAQTAELLLSAEQPPLSELREILADIARDDRRADAVIGRVRGLFRKQEIQMQPLDLNEAVADVLEIIAGDARRRGVKVRFDPTRNLPAVSGDRVHLQQVLLNLIVNAMDAMLATPEPARLLGIETRHLPDGAAVSVSDRGPGIPADQAGDIFESFVTTKPHGLGLGLSVARYIIERHEGSIWVENNAEGGATVSFRVPLAPPTGC